MDAQGRKESSRSFAAFFGVELDVDDGGFTSRFVGAVEVGSSAAILIVEGLRTPEFLWRLYWYRN